MKNIKATKILTNKLKNNKQKKDEERTMENVLKELSNGIENILNGMIPESIKESDRYCGDCDGEETYFAPIAQITKIIPFKWASIIEKDNSIDAEFDGKIEHFNNVDEFLKILENQMDNFKKENNFTNEDVKERIFYGSLKVTLSEKMRKLADKNKLKEALDIEQVSNACFEEFVKKIENEAANGERSIRAELEDIITPKMYKKFKLRQVKDYKSFVNKIYEKVLKMFENENFKIIEKRVPYTCNPMPKYITYIQW